MPLIKGDVARLWREGVRLFVEQFEAGSYHQGTVEPFDLLDDTTKHWAVLAATRNLLDAQTNATPNLYIEATTCAIFNFVADQVIHEHTWSKLARAGLLEQRPFESFWRTLLIDAYVAVVGEDTNVQVEGHDRASWINMVNRVKYSIVRRRDWNLLHALSDCDREDAFALLGIPDDYFSLDTALPPKHHQSSVSAAKAELHGYVVGDLGTWEYKTKRVGQKTVQEAAKLSKVHPTPASKQQEPTQKSRQHMDKHHPPTHTPLPLPKQSPHHTTHPIQHTTNLLEFPTPRLPAASRPTPRFATPRGPIPSFHSATKTTESNEKTCDITATTATKTQPSTPCLLPIKQEATSDPKTAPTLMDTDTGEGEKTERKGGSKQSGRKTKKTTPKQTHRPHTRLQVQMETLEQMSGAKGVKKEN